jgi:hypothetical protein
MSHLHPPSLSKTDSVGEKNTKSALSAETNLKKRLIHKRGEEFTASNRHSPNESFSPLSQAASVFNY